MKKNLVFKICSSIFCIVILVAFFFAIKNNNSSPKNDISEGRCGQKNLPYLNSKLSADERVGDLLGRMNEQEKIGQMLLIEKNSIHNIHDISRYNIGALLSGGGAGPKVDTPEAWLQMVNNFQAETKKLVLKYLCFTV